MSGIGSTGNNLFIDLRGVAAALATGGTRKTEAVDTPAALPPPGVTQRLLAEHDTPALRRPGPVAPDTVPLTLASLGGLRDATPSIFLIAKVIQDANLQNREAARQDRAAARDADVAAQKEAANKTRDMAGFNFAATIVTSAISVVGSVVSIKGALKAQETRAPAQAEAKELNLEADALRAQAKDATDALEVAPSPDAKPLVTADSAEKIATADAAAKATPPDEALGSTDARPNSWVHAKPQATEAPPRVTIGVRNGPAAEAEAQAAAESVPPNRPPPMPPLPKTPTGTAAAGALPEEASPAMPDRPPPMPPLPKVPGGTNSTSSTGVPPDEELTAMPDRPAPMPPLPQPSAGVDAAAADAPPPRPSTPAPMEPPAGRSFRTGQADETEIVEVEVPLPAPAESPADLLARAGRADAKAAAILGEAEGKAVQIDKIHFATAQIITESGKIIGAGLQRAAAEKDAEKAEAQAKSTVARNRAEDETDFYRGYADNIRAVLEKLSSIEEADANTKANIIRSFG